MSYQGGRSTGVASRPGTLIDQVFCGAFARGADAGALFPGRFAGSAGLRPISFIIPDMARLRSLSVQSTLVSNSEVPAALRISTTYRVAFGLRGGMGPH